MTTFEPMYLAITLPKGYAKEYKDRNLFDSIYFSKLSMYHEQEGYIPILYDFQLQHNGVPDEPVPDKMLMTFYYPETKRMSNLNGIVVMGGQPDIYEAYQLTKQITPYLESLTLDKHGISHTQTISTIDESLHQLANPTTIRSARSVLKRSLSKKGEDLETFFPFLADTQYDQSNLSLPDDFAIDAVFMFGITEEFFSSTSIGTGISSLKLYHRQGSTLSPSLAFPLIFKWQPVYNDILKQLKQSRSALSPDYRGRLVPQTVIFKHHDDDQITALISAIEYDQGKFTYHVAVANSNHDDGQPLSLLQAALSREKFGRSAWVDRLDNRNIIPKDSIKDQDYAEDLISEKLKMVVPETDLTSDGVFDLGKLRAIEVEDS